MVHNDIVAEVEWRWSSRPEEKATKDWYSYPGSTYDTEYGSEVAVTIKMGPWAKESFSIEFLSGWVWGKFEWGRPVSEQTGEIEARQVERLVKNIMESNLLTSAATYVAIDFCDSLIQLLTKSSTELPDSSTVVEVDRAELEYEWSEDPSDDDEGVLYESPEGSYLLTCQPVVKLYAGERFITRARGRIASGIAAWIYIRHLDSDSELIIHEADRKRYVTVGELEHERLLGLSRDLQDERIARQGIREIMAQSIKTQQEKRRSLSSK